MTLSGAPAANQLAVANPWAMVPSLGNLDAYISAANRLPLLTKEEEQRFARRLRDNNDLEAAGIHDMVRATCDYDLEQLDRFASEIVREFGSI